jgi:multicomponent K+:H+ antiporter subunit D
LGLDLGAPAAHEPRGGAGLRPAGSTLFWKSEAIGPATEAPGGRSDPRFAVAAAALLLGGTVALSLFAGPVMRQIDATAAQILDTRAYMAAVLGPERQAALQAEAR